MGYLGLDETPVKDDNMFQRMFWPSDHAGETDQLSKQGFWVCFVIGIASLLVMTVQSHPVLGLLSGIFYVLGGIGVREHSQPAAIFVAAAYILNLFVSLIAGVPPGLLPLAAAVLLLANIRGTFIAAKWASKGDPYAMPPRMSETLSDKLVDQMPLKVWPKAKVLFFCVGGVYLLLTLLGGVMLAMGVSRKVETGKQPQRPSATLEVSPSR